MSDREKRLVWVDLETTGPDPRVATILEIATLVTDETLGIVAVGPELVIHADPGELATMPHAFAEAHAKSGLTDRVRASTVTMADAEAATAEFIAEHCALNTAPLCGDAVWKDKELLQRYMPRVTASLHYRIVDVSTIAELVRRWYPADVAAPPTSAGRSPGEHIRASIATLSYYRAKVFR